LTARQTNLLLYSVAATAGLATLACALFALTIPAEVAAPPAAVPRLVRPATIPTSNPSIPPLASFEAIWSLPLRKPLTTVAATTTAPTAPDVAAAIPANLSITLVGTIGNSTALVRAANGSIEVRSVGEITSGARILAIRPSQIDLDFNGQRITLTKPKDPSGG